jgi:hypothetical protein
LFNPTEIGRGDSTLQHTLTHEFTHAAMGPLTTGYTPLWLVEGFAEYVAYGSETVNATAVGQELRRVAPTGLPADNTFYDSADNYLVGWQACRYTAEKYGQAKLIALYSYYHDQSGDGISSVLGVSDTQFTSDFLSYVKKQEG